MIKSINQFFLVGIISLMFIVISCTDDPIEVPEPDRTPPQAVIMYPVDGESVSGQVLISVYATDNDNVDSVQFYINQELAHTDTTKGINNQFSYTWNTLETITIDQETEKRFSEDDYHYISVIAFDPYENTYATSPIRSMIDNVDNQNPNGYILNPFYGQSVSDTVDFTVVANDNDSVKHVGFYINNNLHIEDMEPPYIYRWNTNSVESGRNYSLHAQIKDINNNISIINPILVFVYNYYIDTNPPTGIISNPISGQTISGEVNFTVIAQDDQGIAEVQLFIGTDTVAVIDNSPYTYIWDTMGYEQNRDYTLSAKIIDYAGNDTYLQPILVTISN